MISLVVAAAENDVIGRTGTMLPWNLPDDLAHFREITRGRPIIMGRKTYDSIGRPLPKRRNIVISRQAGLIIPGCEVVASLDEAIVAALEDGDGEIFVIGGGQIFEQALPHAARIYLTRVHAEVEGDAYFRYDPKVWQEESREHHPKDEHNDYAFTFINLSRNLLN
jgi:dihydrofolate reductase